MNLYLIPSIFSIVGNAMLGIYLFMRNPTSRVTHVFTVLLVLLVGWAFSETMMRSQPSVASALLWGKIVYLNNFFLPSAFLVLSYVYTGGKNPYSIAFSYLLGLGFVPLLFTEKFIEKVEIIHLWGFDVVIGTFFLYFVFFYLVIIGVGVFILLRYYRKSIQEEQRRLRFMLAGFLVALFLITLSNILSRFMYIPLPRMGSVFTLVATMSFAYGMIRHQLLVVPVREKSRTPADARCGALCSTCSGYLDGLCPSCEGGDAAVREACPIYQCSMEKEVVCSDCDLLLKCPTYREYAEKCPFKLDRYGLKLRTSYLWEDPDPRFAVEVFRDYTLRGSFGLLISREHPEKVREKYRLPHVSMLWLSQIEEHGAGIDPTNLPRLTHVISQFIRDTPLTFILLVGMEYLVVHNDFEKVLKHLHMVNDQVMTHNSRFLVVVDPKALDPKELSLLEREMRPLKKDNLFKSPT